MTTPTTTALASHADHLVHRVIVDTEWTTLMTLPKTVSGRAHDGGWVTSHWQAIAFAMRRDQQRVN